MTTGQRVRVKSSGLEGEVTEIRHLFDKSRNSPIEIVYVRNHVVGTTWHRVGELEEA